MGLFIESILVSSTIMIGDIIMSSNTAANKARRKETQARKELKQKQKKEAMAAQPKKEKQAVEKPVEKPKSTSTKMFTLFREVMLNHKQRKENTPVLKKVEQAVHRQYQERRNANGNK
jgi:hypothetical protein